MDKAKKNIGGGLIDGTGIMDSQVKSHIEGNSSVVDIHGGLDSAMSPKQVAGPSQSVSTIGAASGNGKSASSPFPAARAITKPAQPKPVGHQPAKK